LRNAQSFVIVAFRNPHCIQAPLWRRVVSQRAALDRTLTQPKGGYFVGAKVLKGKVLKATVKRETKAKTGASAKPVSTPPSPPRVLKIVEDPRIKLAREQYEGAVGLLSNHKYDRALALFEKVLQSPSAELAERARVHINICRQRIERTKTPAFKTAEDHYNYAVAQINTGHLADAEEHLQKAMKLTPRAGHLYYALAAVLSLRRDVESSLQSLRQAIDLDPRTRLLARSDHDFHALYEDPRFADLVYPERD
jgi:tetratricopeptide (TPR) repeat protein